MITSLPNLTGASGKRAFILLKALAAMGFMAGANLVILYAC